MEQFRRKIAENPKEFLKLIRQTEKKTGLPITADLYKRAKESPNDALAPYFGWKSNISCVVEEEVGEGMFGPELGQRACQLIEQLIPLYEYFNQFSV